MLRWYLIHTKPLCEGLAQANLERQGYQVYLPRAIQSVRCNGHWRERIVALFPRYLFLRLAEGRQSLSPARSTLGVTSVVRFGSSYTIVPDASKDSTVSSMGTLMPGTPVRIRQGPFDGLEGVFEREAGAERGVVLLNLLGQAVSAHIPGDCVLPQLVV